MSGQLFVISGPSGVGKSTIIQLLRERVPGLGYSISHTSRKPRDNEVNAVDYHFVDIKSFNKMIDGGTFVEWAKVYDDLYGTSFSSLHDQMNQGLDVVMDLDSQGARNVKEHLKESTLIYILPPSLAILEKRLRERATDDEKIIDRRLEKAFKDIKNCVWYDYIVLNDKLDEAITKVESIIISERCRSSRMRPKVKDMLGQ